MAETITVRHTSCGHEFQVEGVQALPPSARETSDPAIYDISEAVDCPVCNPPEQMPDY